MFLPAPEVDNEGLGPKGRVRLPFLTIIPSVILWATVLPVLLTLGSLGQVQRLLLCCVLGQRDKVLLGEGNDLGHFTDEKVLEALGYLNPKELGNKMGRAELGSRES